jgi:ElaB/YqjD/DUF883 family membrane-anchored ribosome-binding protein
MASNQSSVEELEARAERERQRLSRDIGEVRLEASRELDVQRRIDDRIHEKPGTAYGIAAGGALFLGYLFGRLLKA